VTALGELMRRDGFPAPDPPLERFAAVPGRRLLEISWGEGFARRLTITWATRARGTLWHRGGEPAAYSYAADGGGIGPIAGMDAGAAADALRAELAHGDGRPVDVVVPGSARELVAAALEGGLRFYAPPGLLVVSPGVDLPRALAISGYWLL